MRQTLIAVKIAVVVTMTAAGCIPEEEPSAAGSSTSGPSTDRYSCEDIIDEVEDLESGLMRVRAVSVYDYRQVPTDSEYNTLKCHGTATLTTGEDELIVFGVREAGEMALQVVSLGWQNDESAYNYFDEDLCAEYEFGSGCEVLEGKGVLVLRYDVTRLSGEPDSFYFDHKLAMGNGLVVDGSDMHCVGSASVELAPGGDAAAHETCFVVDTAEIGDQALVGLAVGFDDAYWVQVPITAPAIDLDSATRAVVEMVQCAIGMTVDGVAGPNTRGAYAEHGPMTEAEASAACERLQSENADNTAETGEE